VRLTWRRDLGRLCGEASASARVFNDAGGGKNDAGIAALALLELEGIAAAAVSHESARIGDALDAWENGIVSHVNASAAEAGISTGETLREAVGWFMPKRY
jgi:hypothetical protein